MPAFFSENLSAAEAKGLAEQKDFLYHYEYGTKK